jgi:hypothetical protein
MDYASETEFAFDAPYDGGNYDGYDSGGMSGLAIAGIIVLIVLVVWAVASVGYMNQWDFGLGPGLGLWDAGCPTETNWYGMGSTACGASNLSNTGVNEHLSAVWKQGNGNDERLSAVWKRGNGERLIAGGTKHKSMYQGSLERTCGRQNY